ncbi:uncharacterized protein LDX57_002954 [Aspergillus melleus]|uniref:uncharacterized protein n=1 Tax=Aspergillus melleus TaxID=138277 RepID=UPI001E8C9E41|nr:uncharacterized protein LDX57_002954 [Aspergillus melleus]KAH8425195.1 hypothetical protein LDX57_002954 [Aspergillus melleus]
MDTKRQIIFNDIVRIRKSLERYPRNLFQNEQLGRLGVRATTVPLTTNKFPKFKPCFFIPQGIKSADIERSRKFARYDSGEGGNKGLRSLKKHAESLRPRGQFPVILSNFHNSIINTLKDEGFNVFDNTSLSCSGPYSKGKWPFNPELQLLEPRSRHNRWKVYLCLEDPTHAVPHAIMDVRVDTEDPGARLTVSEVKAIVRMMETRMGFPSYQHHLVLPLLVVSYFGPERARIIQAHHDGKLMNIQYTDTVFIDDNFVGKFLGYYCSRPIGLTVPNRHV